MDGPIQIKEIGENIWLDLVILKSLLLKTDPLSFVKVCTNNKLNVELWFFTWNLNNVIVYVWSVV